MKLPPIAVELARKIRLLFRNRWLRIGLQVVVLALSLAYLAANLAQAGEAGRGVQLHYGRLALAWALAMGSVLLGAAAWRLTLRGLGLPAGWKESLRAHLLSNLAKYAPGYAWQLLGKAYLTRQMGLSARAIGLAMLLELGQLVSIGLVLAVVSLPAGLALPWAGAAGLAQSLHRCRWFALPFLALIPLALILARKRNLAFGLELKIAPGMILAASLAIAAGWLLLGASFWLLGAALLPLTAADFPFFLFTLAASFLIGLAIVVAPGSLGVRESLMVYLLRSAQVPAPTAVLVAALSRLVITLAELASAFLVEVFVRLGLPARRERRNLR